MTSSGFFRARRSVDPKPIHYGSFPRESRSTSSLNDLSAAWENVDEARTALEAVEARIHEANIGVSHRTDNDDNFEEPPIREVFSQNQRLGRVSRYELRPTINERQYSRDMNHSSRHHLFDIPSSRERTRASHTPSIQNYNGSKYYDRHSPPSRDLRTISPPYINDTNAIESSLLDDNLSLKRDVDDKRTREDTANSATHLGTSNFEDSLEVSATKRKQVNGVRPLSPKVAIADHSEALARLKERIKKQKARTPAPKQKENEDVVVNVIQPISEDRQTHDETYIKPVCKRKVVTGAPPTGYKGFSIPDSTTVPSKDKQGRTQYRNGSLPYSSKAGHKRTNKPHKPSQITDAKIPKGGAKMRRITASRPPMDFITPFTWRTGIETVKKVLGPSNTRPKSTASTRPQSSQNTTTTSSRIENGERYEKEEEEKVVPEEKVTQEDKADDTVLSEDILSEGLLSEDAKNILSDLEMDSDNSDNEDEPIKGGKPKLDTNNVPKRKSSSPDKEVQRAKKVKPKTKKKMFPNHKSPDTSPPKSIDVQRHYDVDKVKKYMDKKIQDRKENMKKDKQLKQEAVDGRKKRLQELYNKQKKILNTNLSQNTSTRHKMGETHSVIPGNFNFQHHPYNLHPEFFHQDPSESDKESTDVASYAGLPGPSERRQQKPTIHDFNRHSVASSDVSSEMSVESLDKDHVMSPDGQEDKEDDRADVTMTPEENSFTRSSRVNRETPREEREGRDICPGFPTHDYSVSPEASSSVTHPPQPHSVVDELIPGPSRTDRIEAIRNKAALLKQRLEREAKRLGLSLLDNQKLGKPPPSVGMTAWEPDVFRGNLPGVSNLHEQAELNEQLESMNSAATRIQAVYRGYSTRQGLNWKLPSGRTLGGIIRNAPRQTAVEGRVESMPLYLASDASSESNLSDVETAYSHISDRSLHSRNRKPTSALESRSYSAATQSTASKGYSSPLSRGHYRPSTTLGKSFTEGKGDRMSVINIYLRNLRQGEEERPRDTVNMDEELETASLYSDSQIDKFSDTASLIKDIEDLKEDVDLDKTLVKESPTKTGHEYDTMEQELDDDGKQTPSVNHSYSHSFSSHGSPSRSSLTHSQTDTEYSPIRHSVKSTTPPRAVDDSTHPGHPTTRYPPSMYFPNRQGGDRMSPGSLDHRMMAELNRLEFMEESVRQLTDIERTNSVSLAQQETVSLAQILKAKQASYAKDMEALQLKAQQEKLDSARQLDEARHTAVQSSINAQETVAKVKSDAASSIAQSTDRLVKAQTEASRMTTESAKRVEEARTEAARTLLDAANKHVTAVGTVASSAASAAAQEAVRTTLEQFRQEQRPSRKHDSSRSSLESRSYSNYSRGSYTEERSPSYSRSRSSRIATEIDSGASKGATGDGYTSDEFESFKESEVARSVRTASPDRTYPADKIDSSFIRDRDRSETKSSDSIPEEVDLSVSEGSVVSDVVISDKSVKEAADSSDHKPKDKTDHDYSMTFEDSVMSSRTVTDDEMDYRLILPSEGHRRRSIGKSQRSGSICSDAGTVSYSSDDNADKHLSESIHEKNTPFSGEDSFSKFTTDMVKLMREEEVRAKHLEALLHLREKALKENSKAEMEWLELQKKQMRDKRADDVMPYIKKRQRDVIKRLKAEKAEIKYLMAANRAARYDRKLLMVNQEEITRLRRSTQKIRGKVREEEAVTSRDQDKITNEVPESVSEHTRRSTPLLDERLQDESPSKSTTIPEEFSAIESPTADSSFPTYDHESTITERVRKRSLSEGESDDGAPSGSFASRSKGSPTSSDSIVMQQLKKLKSQSSERYLTQREQKLMRRKHEGEDTLSSDRRLIEWERHLDEEEDKLNDVNRIKSQKSKRAITDTESKAKEEDLANMPPDRSRESSIPEIDSISKDISEASDHSDVETRIRELRQQLQQREREVRRLHKEKKRQKRAMLHEEEENLRKKLQAVERILQQTKDNFERPAAEIKPAETAPNTSGAVHPSESKESIPERSSSSESARDEPRSTVREKSRSEDEAQDVRVSESRESIPERSFSGEGFLKGLNVVLDLDFGSQDREAAVADNESVNKSVSEVKDLDISDRSGLFSSSEKQMNHTHSYTDEIEDNAMTAEDISEASEIQTISGASEAEVPSRSLSVRSDQKERSRAESDESLPEILSTRSSRRPDSENSVPEELSVKSYRRSVDESISEGISKRSSQRSGSESISEALSLKSSQKSATVSIPEALSARSSRRSEDESLPEAISARSSKATEFSSHHSKPPAKDYSNTFESDRTHDEGETDDDISEQIIEEEENISPDKETTQKSYSSDFEVSESPKSKIGDSLDIKEISLQNASLYSQDFESPSSSHRADQLSLEKSIPRSYRDDLDELTQRRLSQASNEESIVEEVPEEDYRSIESGSLSDASNEMTPRVSLRKEDMDSQKLSEHEEDQMVAWEKDTSQYSQDFESPSSHRDSKHSSEKESCSKHLSRNEDLERKLNEEPKPRVSEATDEESVVEEIPEDRASVESGALSDASDEMTPRFSLSNRKDSDNVGQDTVHQQSKYEDGGVLDEEKETSQYSQELESPSPHRMSEHSLDKENRSKSPSRKDEPDRELEVSSQRRLSEATDEGSVVEDLPEETLETGALSDADELSPRFESKEEKAGKMDSVVLPSKDEDEKPLVEGKDNEVEDTVKKPVEEPKEFRSKLVDKISHDLSNNLMDEAVTCITSLYDEHRLRTTPQQLPVGLKTSTAGEEPDKSNAVEFQADSEKENSDSFNEWGKAPEEGFEISEGEDLSISEKISFAEDDESSPILDLKPLVSEPEKDKADQSLAPKTEEIESTKPTDDKKGQSDAVIDQLSENLLKEAASEMIALMRKKQAKEEKAEKAEKKEPPKSPPLHSPEHSPQQRGFDKFMAVHRFPDEVLKQVSPPGSPTKDHSVFDGNELANKLSQLKLLHEELGAQLGEDDDDDDDFVINENKPLELPTDNEEYGPPSGQSIPIVVPHISSEVVSIVTTSLSSFYRHKKAGGSLGSLSPPPEFSESNIDNDDPDSQMKQSYRRMIFDLTGEVFRDVLNEETPPTRPPWMKPRRCRRNRFYHTLLPTMDEYDYLPVVQQHVLDLVGLGNERPNLETLRRKTPLKVGKKDFVDAVLIQELREEEPQWVDYDDDELAVKFQVADAIFESLMSETIMVLNAVHRRKESKVDRSR